MSAGAIIVWPLVFALVCVVAYHLVRTAYVGIRRDRLIRQDGQARRGYRE